MTTEPNLEFTVYALADPNSHEIRHVDLYHFAEGSSINARPFPASVREWAESLKPREPIQVHLATLAHNDALTNEENYEAAYALERKWLRWLSNSPLLTPGVVPQESSDTE